MSSASDGSAGITAWIITFVGDRQDEIGGKGSKLYTVDGNPRETFSGVSSNDAPMQYLLSKAAQPGTERIRILAVVSDKVFHVLPDAHESAYQVFCRKIGLFAREQGTGDRFDPATGIIPLHYDFDPETGAPVPSIHERTAHINTVIYSRIIGEDPGARKQVYIDFTTGFRDISFLFTSIIQFLGFYDIELSRIVYSNVQEARIYSLKYITGITDLIQALNSFRLTGNVRQLRELFDTPYMEDKFSGGNPQELETVKDVLRAFDSFFGCVSLNNVNDIDPCKAELERCVGRMVPLASSDNMYIAMFARLFSEIRQQFFLDGTNEIPYDKLIRWCLEHDFVNQALTLYVERLPEMYFASAYIRSFCDPDNPESLDSRDGSLMGKSIYSECFYTRVFENVSGCRFKQFEPLKALLYSPVSLTVQGIDRFCSRGDVRAALKGGDGQKLQTLIRTILPGEIRLMPTEICDSLEGEQLASLKERMDVSSKKFAAFFARCFDGKGNKRPGVSAPSSQVVINKTVCSQLKTFQTPTAGPKMINYLLENNSGACPYTLHYQETALQASNGYDERELRERELMWLFRKALFYFGNLCDQANRFLSSEQRVQFIRREIRGYVLSFLKQNQVHSEILERATDRLEDLLNGYFDEQGRLIPGKSLPLIQLSTNLLNILSLLCANNSVLLHYLVFSDPAKLEEFIGWKNAGVYEKKLRIIHEMVSSKVSTENTVRLANLMKFYLYAKIMRNRINHAQDAEQTNPQDLESQKLVLGMMATDLGGLQKITPEFRFDSLKENLLRGLELPLPD